jgi:adenosylhomocysteine nucleosidase
MGSEPGVIAVVGLSREARIASRARLTPVVSAANAELLEKRLVAATAKALPKGIVSFGIAGALAPLLKVGDILIATHVVHGDEHYRTDPAWSEALRNALPHAQSVVIAGHDQVVNHVDGKRRLFALTGAHAVDMESHIAARFAARHGLPFVVVRAISDIAAKGVPPAALEPLKDSGKPSLRRVLSSLAADPGQFRDVLGMGRDAGRAFRALSRARKALGAQLGFPYGVP